jgi:excisionase family DNA binding protein
MGSADTDRPTQSDLDLTVGEVAAKLRTTPRTVQRWIREHRLRAIRTPGGQYRIRPEDLDAAMIATTT